MTEAKKKDLGASEVQKQVDEAEEKGYLGTEADPTPNSHYSVDGVTSGKPTPETDPKSAQKAAEHQQKVSEEVSG